MTVESDVAVPSLNGGQRACPTVASFGGRDAAVPSAYPDRLAENLQALGVPHDVKVYPDAGHSFMTRAEGVTGNLLPRTPIHAEYHEPSAADAMARMLAFFREHL